MAVSLISASEAYQLSGANILVCGFAGAGKTTLATTAPNSFLISAESGLLSIAGRDDYPVMNVRNHSEVMDALRFCQSSAEMKDFETVCIDSLSEICENVLQKEKSSNSNQLQAYGKFNDTIIPLIKAFRDLPEKNIYMTAKLDTRQEPYQVLTPGAAVTNQIPYLFDEVAWLQAVTDEKNTERFLQFAADEKFAAKDRSGLLSGREPADLAQIFQKIQHRMTEIENSKTEK